MKSALLFPLPPKTGVRTKKMPPPDKAQLMFIEMDVLNDFIYFELQGVNTDTFDDYKGRTRFEAMIDNACKFNYWQHIELTKAKKIRGYLKRLIYLCQRLDLDSKKHRKALIEINKFIKPSC